MKNYLLMPLLALGALTGAAWAAADTATIFHDNTLYFQNQATKVSGSLWLNADGSYQVFFNRGVQQTVPQSAAGPFQYEGREGTYSVKAGANGPQACLKPDTSTAFTYNTEQAGEIFAAAQCYDLPNLAVGQSAIAQAADGKNYKMWLLQGR